MKHYMNAQEANIRTKNNIKDFDDSTLDRVYEEIQNAVENMKFEVWIHEYIENEKILNKLKSDGYYVGYDSNYCETIISWYSK